MFAQHQCCSPPSQCQVERFTEKLVGFPGFPVFLGGDDLQYLQVIRREPLNFNHNIDVIKLDYIDILFHLLVG